MYIKLYKILLGMFPKIIFNKALIGALIYVGLCTIY